MSHFTLENDKKYMQILSLGVRFNSPEERYRVGAQIVCDRCQSTPIFQGYGLGNQDLCLPCVDKVRKACGLPDISDRHTLMVQRQFRHPSEEELTFMLQDQFQTRIRGNNPRDEPAQSSSARTYMLQDQFRSRGGNTPNTDGTTDPVITTNMEQGIYWRTKMAAGMFDPPKPRSSGYGADELATRLAEMQRLREQPIGSFDDVSGGIRGFDGGNSMGGSSLDTQFGSLLTPELSRAQVPKPPAPTPSLQTPPEESRYGNGSALTRMSQGMFRTRMEMGMFRKK